MTDDKDILFCDSDQVYKTPTPASEDPGFDEGVILNRLQQGIA